MTGSGAAGCSGWGGGTNFKVTSFWEPHFQRLFLAARPVTRLRGATQEGIVTTRSKIFPILRGTFSIKIGINFAPQHSTGLKD